MSEKRLLTVGHSNREPAEFIELLHRQQMADRLPSQPAIRSITGPRRSMPVSFMSRPWKRKESRE